MGEGVGGGEFTSFCPPSPPSSPTAGRGGLGDYFLSNLDKAERVFSCKESGMKDR